METEQPFIDYYSILEVHPECSARSLEVAYHNLAKIYHPDHPETSDISKFSAIVQAYRALRNPEDRAKYDVQYNIQTGFSFTPTEDVVKNERAAISDSDTHSKIMLFLYKKRRESSRDPGVGHYSIKRMLNCSEEEFEFHIWYLKEKGFIDYTDDGTLAITIVGVDHVIATSRTSAHEKLRITQSTTPPAENQP